MIKTIKNEYRILALICAAFAISACGGGSTTEPSQTGSSTSETGTVGLLFTDAPTDDFESIFLNVREAVLIGGDEQQHFLFQGSEPIDLLNLTNFNEPIVFGEVQAGTYTKLRLLIDDLELVPNDGGPSIFPRLPANGKIDLLQSDGFEILPGRTLMIEVDMDANKSIKVTGAGNSNNYNFRPVVKVKVMSGGSDDKLTRLEGSVREVSSLVDRRFVVCDIDSPDFCVTVALDANAGIFDALGLDTGFDTLLEGDIVVVIGAYETDPDILLNAVVLEIGGTAEQVKGNVVSNPANDQFLIVVDQNGDLVVELQDGTKVFDVTGPANADTIEVGVDVEVEGVKPPKADQLDPDLIRAALIYVEEDPDEQISGTIIEPLDAATRSFGLTLSDAGDTCVRVDTNADILLVNEAISEVTMGEFADLTVGQSIDLFGTTADDSCFDANEVIVAIESAQ